MAGAQLLLEAARALEVEGISVFMDISGHLWLTAGLDSKHTALGIAA